MQRYDIFLIQESFYTNENEHLWQSEWGGKAYFANGVNNDHGIIILIGDRFPGEIIEVMKDPNGRFLILKFQIENKMFLLSNLYVSNQDKAEFFGKDVWDANYEPHYWR